nr:hypothetical protein [uncultured bacterium]
MSRFARLVEAQEKRVTEQPAPSIEDSPSNIDTLSNTDSPSTQDSPVIKDRLAVTDSLSPEHPPPLPVVRPSNLDRQATKDSPSTSDRFEVRSLLPDVKGHTQLPHRYTDHLPRWLSADEQAVYIQLYRLSWGWGKDTCFISNPKLAERSGVPETSMRRAVKKLVGKGLIEKTDRKFGGVEQGIEYRVFNLDRLTGGDRASNTDGPSNMAPNKEKDLKEKQKGVDASLCPDCMGTGFYYPQGTAKGVARCPHAKLVR